MKTDERHLATLFMLTVSALVLGCSGNKKKQEDRYYYYPRKNIYYDIDQKRYIRFNDSTATWQSTDTISKGQAASLGKKVLIVHPAHPVYKNNENDRLVYSVSLYSSPAAIHQAFFEDSVNSIQKAAGARRNGEGERRVVLKKPGFLKRLFDNLFH